MSGVVEAARRPEGRPDSSSNLSNSQSSTVIATPASLLVIATDCTNVPQPGGTARSLRYAGTMGSEDFGAITFCDRRMVVTTFRPTPILVPTDFSAASADAVRIARNIAQSDSEVVVLYVGLDHDLVAPGHIWGMDSYPQDNAANRQQRLSKWVAENGLGAVRQETRCGDGVTVKCCVRRKLFRRRFRFELYGSVKVCCLLP